VIELMIIESYEPPRRFTPWLHKSFIGIYLLLGVRVLIAAFEGPVNFPNQPENSLLVLYVKRVAGIVYDPFSHVLYGASFDSNASLYVTIVLAIVSYAFLHYGMMMPISDEGRLSMADRILKLCKAMFFLLGTLLLLLIVARMSVMLYQDLRFGKLILAVPQRK